MALRSARYHTFNKLLKKTMLKEDEVRLLKMVDFTINSKRQKRALRKHAY